MSGTAPIIKDLHFLVLSIPGTCEIEVELAQAPVAGLNPTFLIGPGATLEGARTTVLKTPDPAAY